MRDKPRGSLFAPSQLRRVVDLQSRAYRLLVWLNNVLKSERARLEIPHHLPDFAEAAEEFVRSNSANFPTEILPPTGATREFARLFASLLDTSFEVTRESKVGRDGPGSCFCPICVRVVTAPHFKPRRLTPEAKRRSRQLKQDYLLDLAEPLKLTLGYEDLDQLIDPASDLATGVALATYGYGLIVRSETGLGDPGLLPLWREFAWAEGKPNRDFVLEADAILEAEQKIAERLRRYRP